MPVSNAGYWRKKFERNVSRFKEVRKSLVKDGWKVIVVWECQTSPEEKLDSLIERKAKEWEKGKG